MESNVLLAMIFAFPALLLPLIVGMIILISSRGDRFGRFAGLFTLKPLVATPIWAFILSLPPGWESASAIQQVLSLIPGFGLSLIIVLAFRDLFRSATLFACIFLAVDVIRWLNTYLWLRNVNHDGGFLLLACVLPSAYALMALVILRLRRRQAKAAA